MTNQAILSIFDYLCNEARNSVHGLFGLMELSGDTASDFAWRGYIDGGRSVRTGCCAPSTMSVNCWGPSFRPAKRRRSLRLLCAWERPSTF